MPLGKDIDELLTGYVDGQLTSDELSWMQSALQQDPSLAVRLSELRGLSQDLRDLGQNRLQGLSVDFTSRVMARCADVASQPRASDGLAANLQQSLAQDPLQIPKQTLSSDVAGRWKSPLRRRSHYRRVAAFFVALASMISLAVWLPQNWWSDEPLHTLLDHSNSSGLPQPELGSPESSISSSSDRIASASEPGDQNDSVSDFVFPGDVTGLASSDPDAWDSNRMSETFGLGSDGRAQLASQRPEAAQINFLLVVDLEITQQAAKQNLLGSLLSKYGISLSIGVPFNSEIDKAVSRMRYSVPEGQRAGPVELMLVRAPAALLDAAVGELEAAVDMVPVYRFDLAFQTPSVSLSQVILDSLNSQIAADISLAIPLLADLDSSQVARLDSIPNQGTLVSSNRRRERFDSAPDGVGMAGDMSYLLILIRQQ